MICEHKLGSQFATGSETGTSRERESMTPLCPLEQAHVTFL